MSELWLCWLSPLSSVSAASHPNAGILLTAVLGFLGACVTGLVVWLNGRGTNSASLQNEVTERLRTLMGELTADRARQIVRVSELEQENELLRDRLGDALRDRDHAELQQQIVTRLLTTRGAFPVPMDGLPPEEDVTG